MTNNRLSNENDRKSSLLRQFRGSIERGRGASATEMIILLVLIAVVCIGVFRLFGGTIKNKLTGAQATVAAVGTEEKQTQGSFEQASAAGSGGGSAKSADSNRKSQAGASGRSVANQGGQAIAPSTSVAKVEQKPGSVGGFNPWILAIFLGLAGLLVYVFFAKKSD